MENTQNTIPSTSSEQPEPEAPEIYEAEGVELKCYRPPPPVVKFPHHFLVTKSFFEDLFWHSVGPAMHKKMTLMPPNRSGDLSVLVPIVPEVYEILISPRLEPKTLSEKEELNDFLGPWKKKTFHLGSYAIIYPPIKFSFRLKEGKVKVGFSYAVFNQNDVLQWPLGYCQ